MKSIPNLVIIVGQDDEMNAVKECNKLQSALELSTQSPAPFGGNKLKASSEFPLTTSQPLRTTPQPLRTIPILDTNCDPSLADLYIPGNDDSAKSIELILNELTLPLCS